ncbi:MAG: hypothetical protein KY459_07110 [Acidobacteria bacterium]|nr:hypothetical protein [Acidobacteriota bacterium]
MQFRIERVPLKSSEKDESNRITTQSEEGESAADALRAVVERERAEMVGEILELPGLGAVLTIRAGGSYQTLSCYPETGPLPIPPRKRPE